MHVLSTKALQTLMSGVRPKKNPNMYAMMSLQITQEIGTMNLDGRRTKPLESAKIRQLHDLTKRAVAS